MIITLLIKDKVINKNNNNKISMINKILLINLHQKVNSFLARLLKKQLCLVNRLMKRLRINTMILRQKRISMSLNKKLRKEERRWL
jgi:hypothetical protein